MSRIDQTALGRYPGAIELDASSDEEINAEIDAARAERRAHKQQEHK